MRATWPLGLLGCAACFTASPLAGVSCDPAAPVCPETQACIATATGFACLPDGTPPVEPPVDAAVEVACPDDPALSVCFSFDAPMLANPLANEGRAGESADLVDVTRIARGAGGAAQIGATSSILIPMNTTIVDIVVMEAAVRIDVPIPDGMRMGIFDGDATEPGMSMFVFGGPAGHQLRCVVGGTNLFADVAIVPGEWIDLACICDNDTVSAIAGGVKVGEAAGCLPSVSTLFGLQIGQDNRGNSGLPPADHLVGALDNVRLWTAVP